MDLLAPSLTVGQWLDAWLSDIKGFDGTRPRTLTSYKGLAERYVKPVIGSVRLDKLTPAHIQRLVTETRNSTASRGTPPSASTLRHVYKLVRNALGDAFRMELVTRNVATQVKAPPLHNKGRVGLDLAEAKRLLKVIDGERLEATCGWQAPDCRAEDQQRAANRRAASARCAPPRRAQEAAGC